MTATPKPILLTTFIWCLLAYSAFAAITCSAQQRLGGMTVNEAFRDERVARMVAAASRGNLQDVDAEIGRGADVNYVGTDGISPLLWLLASRNRRGFEHLLKRGANPNYTDKKRMESAMSLTAGGDWPEALELLLKYGGDSNLPGPRQDPLLLIAASQARKVNIDLLLKYGADINSRNMRRTAATEALTPARFDLAAYLLEKGLSYGLPRLALAAQQRRVGSADARREQEKLLEMLKERGVRLPVPRPVRKAITLDEAFRDPRLTRLLLAGDDVAAIERELRAGADVNQVGANGQTPLLWSLGLVRLPAIEALLKAGANPNYRNEYTKESAMSDAARYGDPKLLALLLEHGGDPRLLGPEDQPLLHIAAGWSHKEHIDLLLRHGLPIDTRNPDGDTAANPAARWGDLDLVAFFLERGLRSDLERLATEVANRSVTPNSPDDKWKQKLSEMFKARGIELRNPSPRASAR